MLARGTLHDTAFMLIKLRAIPLPKIAKETGISYFWLRKFKDDAIPNPGVNTVQKLYEFLSNSALDL